MPVQFVSRTASVPVWGDNLYGISYLEHLRTFSFALSLLWVTDLLTELLLRCPEGGTPWTCTSGHFTLSVDVFLYKLHETSIASALLLIVQLEWGNSSGWTGHCVWKYLHQYSLFSYISKINNNTEVLLLLVINFDLCGKRGCLIQLFIY